MTTSNLTNEQKDLFNTLVRLGDSKKLALETVLKEDKKETEMYEIAYYS